MGDVAPASVTVRDRRARIAASGAFAVQGSVLRRRVVPGADAARQVRPRRDPADHRAGRGPDRRRRGQCARRLAHPAYRQRARAADRRRSASRIAMAAIGLAPTLGVLYAAVAVFGLAVGAVDATMNMQGVAVQRRYGRSILAVLPRLVERGRHRQRPGGDRGRATWTVRWRSSSVALAAVGAVIALSIGPGLLKRARGDRRPAGRAGRGRPPDPVGPGRARRAGRHGHVHRRLGDDELERHLHDRRARCHGRCRAGGAVRLPDLPAARPYGRRPVHRPLRRRWPR